MTNRTTVTVQIHIKILRYTARRFWSRISDNQRVLKTKLLFYTDSKLYLTYGMVRTMFGDLD